ncbi:MAG TPA: PilZ domain-containing protein [Vicinamibacterales bacterium]|jgi:hypothetical protein
MPTMSPLDLVTPDTAENASPLSVRLASDDEVRLVRARDRRAHARRDASDLAWIRLVKLTGGTGFTTTLIDLSEGGALLEVDGPLRPGSRLMLEISGDGLHESVPLEVLRSYIASLRDGAARYRGACAFDHHIALPGQAPAARPADPFVGADAALTYLLDRCIGDSPAACGSERRVALERTEVLHVLEAIYARGAKDSRDPGTRFVVELLGAILPALQSGAPRNDVMATLEARMYAWPTSLRTRLQPTRIRLASIIDRCSLVAASPSPAPSVAAPVPVAAAQPVIEPKVEDPALAPDEKETAFQRIVVRYLDGGIVKGFTQDFHPSRAQFSLWPAINAKPSERQIVPVANLKAVFFVRNFTGNPTRHDKKSFNAPGQGRRLEVTFMDSEVILGTTLSYSPDTQGFFMIPADASGNNTRIFVVSGAVRRVRFF